MNPIDFTKNELANNEQVFVKMSKTTLLLRCDKI